jgi:mannose-6-phosphate isomerase
MATQPEPRAARAIRLDARAVAKPWGRRQLGPWGLGLGGAQPVGEIHHVEAGGPERPLLVKTLFTAERLSVQVHPDAASAAARGHARGKDEAWVVLAAEPGATIGVGLDAPMCPAELRAAALDGSLAERLVWRPAAPGDVFFTPAGTIHAIGGGLTLFEIQQNIDVTYRLYDYGRGRRLDLDAGIAVASRPTWQPAPPRHDGNRELLVESPAFTIERGRGAGRIAASDVAPVWVAVVAGIGHIDGAVLRPGEVWLTEMPLDVTGDAELLLTHEGGGGWTPA